MAEKTFNARVVLKHDSADNWAKATNFTPKQGEIVIYDAEGSGRPRFKIGDGVTNVNALPFMSDVYIGTEDPGVNSGMIWIDTSDVTIMSVDGVEF